MAAPPTDPAASASSPRWDGLSWFFLLAVVGFALVGTHYRVRDFADLALMGDEHHAIIAARDHTLAETFTYYNRAHNTVPLTMYARLLLENKALDEYTMRLPGVIAGLLLLLTPLLFVRRLGRATTLLYFSLSATSPILAYFTFMARPYPITLLLAVVAFFGWDSWHHARTRWGFWLFTVCSGVVVFFHVLSAFFVAALFTASLVGLFTGRVRFKDGLAAVGVTGGIVLALVVPGIPNLLEVAAPNIQYTSADMRFLLEVFQLLGGYIGSTVGLLCIAWVVGIVHWCRRELAFGLAGIATVVFMALGIVVISPKGVATAWSRYVLVAWPVFLIFASTGVGLMVGFVRRQLGSRWLLVAGLGLVAALVLVEPWSPINPKSLPAWRRGVIFALSPFYSWGAVLVYGAAGVWALADRLPTPRLAARGAEASLMACGVLFGLGVLLFSPVRLYARDPDTFRIERRVLRPVVPASFELHGVYHRLVQDPLGGEAVAECPEPLGHREWRAYSHYQTIHKKRVIIVQNPKLPRGAPFARRRSTLDLSDDRDIAASGVRYAILHKDLEGELEACQVKLEQNPRRREDFQRQVNRARNQLRPRWGPPIYEDDQLEVYDLWGWEGGE